MIKPKNSSYGFCKQLGEKDNYQRTRIEPATSNISPRQTDLLENHRQFPTLGAHETNE
jgi:hypothetical protein